MILKTEVERITSAHNTLVGQSQYLSLKLMLTQRKKKCR